MIVKPKVTPIIIKRHILKHHILELPNNNHLAQDTGGPSKGGFLNNRLFSHPDLYLRNAFQIPGPPLTLPEISRKLRSLPHTRTRHVRQVMP